MKNANKQTHILCLVSRVVLGTQGKHYTDRIESLIQSNGIEWTVKRLKAIYTASLHLCNNDREKAIACYQNASISYTKKGLPKDPVLSIPVRRLLGSRRPAVIKNQLALLRSYTALRCDKITKGQVLGIEKSITTEPLYEMEALEEIANEMTSVIESEIPTFYREGLANTKLTFNDFSLDRLRPFTGTYSPVGNEGIPKELQKKPYFKALKSLMTTSYLPRSLQEAVPCKETRTRLLELQSPFGGYTMFSTGLWEAKRDDKNVKLTKAKFKYAGKVHVIQEGGAKARAVAVPNAWVQLGFRPLHDILSKVTLDNFSMNSVVHDQRSGAQCILDHMRDNRRIYCVDLSSATDRFPLKLQTHVLRVLGLGMWAEALEELVSRPWELPQASALGINHKELYYKTGQPMGLYGSFPLFNLTHVLLAKVAEQRVLSSITWKDSDVRPFTDGTYFKIIGDDIVLSNNRMSEAYKTLLDNVGVEVSPTKTIEGIVGEFAGLVVLPTPGRNQGYTGFRPYKYPDGKVITNPISFLENLGVKARRISRYWSKNFEFYRQTRPFRNLIDYSPIFTTDTVNSSISGTLDIRDVGYLRDQIALFHESGPAMWPSDRNKTEFWGNRQPLVDDVYRRYIPLASRLEDALAQSTSKPSHVVEKSLRSDPLMKDAREGLLSGLREDNSHSLFASSIQQCVKENTHEQPEASRKHENKVGRNGPKQT